MTFSSFLSFINLLFKALINGEYSNLACSTTPGLYLGTKSLPVKHSYLSNSLDDNAEIVAVSLSKSYCYNLVINNFTFIS